MKKDRIFVRSLLIRFGIVLLIVLFYRCPVNLLFGVDCPGCGLTRAFFAALQFDFRAAFAYHPLFLPIGIVLAYLLLYEIWHPLFRIPQKAEKVIIVVTAAATLALWICRLIV